MDSQILCVPDRSWLYPTPPFNGIPAWPSGSWLLIGAASALSVTAGILLAWSYGRAEAGYLAATEYSAFAWGTALGWLVFDEPLASPTALGATLIVAGCAIAARRKASTAVPGPA